MSNVEWTNEPPRDKQQPTYTLRRTGTSKINAICLSHHVLGCKTHFWRGRTRPCTGIETCEACQDGQTWRWKGYIALYDEPERKTWIHELTENAYAGLAAGVEAFQTLRGHWVKFERTRPTPNAPVISQVHAQKVAEDRLPTEPDIQQTLYRIWDMLEEVAPPTITRGALNDQLTPGRNGKKPTNI